MGVGEWARDRLTDKGSNEKPLDILCLADSGISESALQTAICVSRDKNIPASEVLIARGEISRENYLRALAKYFGMGYLEEAPDHLCTAIRKLHSDPMTALFKLPAHIQYYEDDALCYAVSPNAEGLSSLLKFAANGPNASARIRLIESRRLRCAWFRLFEEEMLNQACSHLNTRYPLLSAKPPATRRQLFVFSCLSYLLISGWFLIGNAAIFALAVVLTVFYLASALLRIGLIVYLDKLDENQGGCKPGCLSDTGALDPEDYPVYTVISALKGETGQVADLVKALDRLDWPESRREIFLICESEDPATINAIKALPLPDCFSIIECPGANPRTKPKALNYALPLISGKYTVIYDAEDRPDPGQLREAFAAFRSNDANLACVQAPLAISNSGTGWLASMFALEYDVLFRGILPVLAKLSAPLPLGGTSNHFKTDILRMVGGWDPYNVTEDADLGIRLARYGFRCGTISLPTWEAAPTKYWIWTKQRTRWVKGWLQTTLVHMRQPLRTARELGWQSNLLFHLMLTANVISVLAHPIFLCFVIYQFCRLFLWQDMNTASLIFFAVGIFNLVAGYSAYTCFAAALLRRIAPGQSVVRKIPQLIAYWFMISFAGWRGLYQLITDPYHWEKTQHGLAKPATDANIEQNDPAGPGSIPPNI
jgi:glycosyltransferase XagB